MIKFWYDKGKYFNGFGLTGIFAVVISKYVITIKLFNFGFGYSKQLHKFI